MTISAFLRITGLILALGLSLPMHAQQTTDMEQDYVIVIHGGAGAIRKKNMTPELEAAYQERLNAALDAGSAILAEGGSSVDAVQAAIMVMEDSPLFNAGKGAVFTNAERNEMDASIMDGATREAGAVAGVTTVKNPITAAHLVMDQSVHVMLSGDGADEYAKKKGLEIVDPSYFHHDQRFKQLKKVQDREKTQLDHDDDQGDVEVPSSDIEFKIDSDIDLNKKYGTVGAVALDKHGNLAAATSTGGMTNKRYGRIGDSPIIGAGTFADNETCAVSCTGHGEFFMRWVVAYDVAAMMSYGNKTLNEAANHIVYEKLEAVDGRGGLIAVDKDGNIAMPFNTAGMYRGYVKSDGAREVLIYKD